MVVPAEVVGPLRAQAAFTLAMEVAAELVRAPAPRRAVRAAVVHREMQGHSLQRYLKISLGVLVEMVVLVVLVETEVVSGLPVIVVTAVLVLVGREETREEAREIRVLMAGLGV
jgi:hypothetical protein